MRAESTKCRPLAFVVLLGLLNRDASAVFTDSLVLHLARDHRKQRVVAAESDAGPGADLRASLADQDRARIDQLATIDLHAQHLRIRVASVARRPAPLLVCHYLVSFLAVRRVAFLGGAFTVSSATGFSSTTSAFVAAFLGALARPFGLAVLDVTSFSFFSSPTPPMAMISS